MEGNKEILKEITEKIDIILDLSRKDTDLQPFIIAFQFEQAADQAIFEKSKDDPVLHLERVLKRMAKLAVDIDVCILNRTSVQAERKTQSPQREQLYSTSELMKISSADDFSCGEDSLREQNANIFFFCTSVMSLLILANDTLRKKLQNYLLEENILKFIIQALKINKEHELYYFVEGHKTELLRLLANLSYQNSRVCASISDNEEVLLAILSSTKIDEDNPGMGEWAKFTIRNICEGSDEASQKIKKLKPLEVDPESERLRCKGFSYSFTPKGKCRISKS